MFRIGHIKRVMLQCVPSDDHFAPSLSPILLREVIHDPAEEGMES
jgi:hypothetical protein